MTDLQNEFICSMTLKQQIATLRYKHTISSIMAMPEASRCYLVGCEIRDNNVSNGKDLDFMLGVEKLISERVEMKKEKLHLNGRLNQDWLDKVHELLFELDNKGE